MMKKSVRKIVNLSFWGVELILMILVLVLPLTTLTYNGSVMYTYFFTICSGSISSLGNYVDVVSGLILAGIGIMGPILLVSSKKVTKGLGVAFSLGFAGLSFFIMSTTVIAAKNYALQSINYNYDMFGTVIFLILGIVMTAHVIIEIVNSVVLSFKEDAASGGCGSTKRSYMKQRLARLDELLVGELISKEEYDKKKSEIVAQEIAQI